MFQTYLFLKLRNDPEKLDTLNLSLKQIAISITFSILHAFIEFFFLSAETKAN